MPIVVANRAHDRETAPVVTRAACRQQRKARPEATVLTRSATKSGSAEVGPKISAQPATKNMPMATTPAVEALRCCGATC